MSNLSSFDVIILIITGISAIIGLSRGFSKEVLSIIGWILAFICIVTLLPILNPITMKFITNGVVSGVITALCIFIIFLICWSLFTGNVIGKIRTSFLSGVDKFLGLFFGFARAFLLIILLNILITWVIPTEEQSKFFSESKYFSIAGEFAKPIENLIPDETLNDIKSKAKSMSGEEKKADEKAKKKNETDELFNKLARPKVKKKATESTSKAVKEIKTEASTIKPSSTKAPKPDSKPTLEPEGYNNKERKSLDSLIEDSI